MENGASSFPLLNLPNNLLKCVLLNMDFYHQLNFSILSKRSKKIFKSLNIKALEIYVTLNGVVQFTVRFRYPGQMIYNVIIEEYRLDGATEIHDYPMEIYNPDFVLSFICKGGRFETNKWMTQGLEIKDRINHILSLFNRPKLDKIDFRQSIQFDLKSLQKTIKDVYEINIHGSYPVKYIQQVVQTYPTAAKLILPTRTDHNLEDYRMIFCQGWDVLTLRPPYRGSQNCDLNSLLLMNSRSIRVDVSNLSHKDMNKFFKHWMNGSNPRMEHMKIYFSRTINDNQEILLSGLNHHAVSSNQQRVFKSQLKGSDRTVIVKGGYDIQRKDGTTATIMIRQHGEFCVEIFVWH